MVEWPWYALLAGVGIVAGGVAGVVGFGSAVLLLPICHAVFGPVATVGILTVAALIGNLSRVALWIRDVRWAVVWRYWLGGIPFAVLGSVAMVRLDSDWLTLAFGLFIVLLVPVRRQMARRERELKLAHFPAVGAAMGFLSAVVSTTGPINAPFFLAYGLTKGAYLSTEALCTAGVHLTKAFSYGRLAALDSRGIVVGAALGVCLLIGTAVGKPIVARMDKDRFVLVVEALLIGSGVLMVLQAAGLLLR